MGGEQASGHPSHAHSKHATQATWLISLGARWEGYLWPVPHSSLKDLRPSEHRGGGDVTHVTEVPKPVVHWRQEAAKNLGKGAGCCEVPPAPSHSRM